MDHDRSRDRRGLRNDHLLVRDLWWRRTFGNSEIVLKGYHYTSYANWVGIQNEGLLPAPIGHQNILEISSETVGSWLFEYRQDAEALFGMLIDRFATQGQAWRYMELEVDFSITDCLKALHEEDTLKLTHLGVCGNWVYHWKEPIIVVSKPIPVCQITLLRTFNLQRAIHNMGDSIW